MHNRLTSLVRRYKLGEAAAKKFTKVRHQDNGRIICRTFAEMQKNMALEKGDQYCVYFSGDDTVLGITGTI